MKEQPSLVAVSLRSPAFAALQRRCLHMQASRDIIVETAQRRKPLGRKGCRTHTSPWGNEDTQTLIDILEKYKVKATFFVVGDWAVKYPDSVKALADAGHEVMNHSDTHRHFNALSADEIMADVTRCNEKVAAVTGVAPTLIRCPYGEYDDHVVAAIRALGMEPIQWDVEHSATPATRGTGAGYARFLKKVGQKLLLENAERPRTQTGAFPKGDHMKRFILPGLGVRGGRGLPPT